MSINLVGKYKNIRHFLRAINANLKYGSPSRGLVLIGVTGTDGKTTTVMMIYHILKKMGLKVGHLSTVSSDLGAGISPNPFHSTTPDVYEVQRALKDAKGNRLTHFVLEASSHGLDQHRLLGCHFKVGAITNLTADHLDYHHNLSSYLKSKARLFKQSEIKIFNKDDQYSYPRLVRKFKQHISYSQKKEADFNIKSTNLKLQIPGNYNFSNALAAIAVANQLGIKETESVKALQSFVLPEGRFEVIQKEPFQVIVDFAHTPNGLKKFFESLTKPEGGKIIHVFGCAGKRDKTKRPEMGMISSKHADVIILTNEDPRTESIEQINEDIKSGISKKFAGKIIEEPDRKKAIELAFKLAKPKDIMILTGKGHEKTMEIGEKSYLWDEIKIVKEILSDVK